MLIESTPSRLNSQYGINKLLEKDLKQLIFSLDSNQLIALFKNLQIQSQVISSKQFTKIGLKCSECHTIFDSFQSKGYGRDQHQALINSIKIILQTMITSSYKIDSIKKALKYCSKFKQPLINSSQGNSLLSSTKKSIKKVEGMDNAKMTRKHLEYGQQSSNKENVSRKINETLDLSINQCDDKITIDSNEIRLGREKFHKGLQGKQSSPIFQTDNLQESSQSNQTDKKCSQLVAGKECIYFEMFQHSEKQTKSLNARIKLLEQENSMLKELLLKDFNRQLFNKNKTEIVTRTQTN